MAELNETHRSWLEQRKILQAAIRTGCFSDPRDPNGRVLAVPYVHQGRIINHKYRAPGKKFWMDEGQPRLFWNMDCLSAEGLQHLPLIVTEGEWDALAAMEASFERVVSVPNGSDSDLEFMKHHWPEVSKAMRVILCGDGDEPGAKLNTMLAQRFGHARCFVIEYPDGCKDLNDILVYFGAEGVQETIHAAKPFPVKGLYKLEDYPQQAEVVNYSTGWPELDHYFRPIRGALTVVTGVPSSGKSLFTTALLCNILETNNHRAAVASFEMPVVPYLRNDLRMHLAAHGFGTHPAADTWISDRMLFIDQISWEEHDQATLEWVLDRAATAVIRTGCEWLLIDPWNQIDISDQDGRLGSEALQRRQLKELKRFAKAYDVGVIVVAHPTKSVVQKDGSIRRPDLYDIAGSAHWRNACDHGLVLNRPLSLQKVPVPWVHIFIEKVRFRGTGRRGNLWMKWDDVQRCYVPHTPSKTDIDTWSEEPFAPFTRGSSNPMHWEH